MLRYRIVAALSVGLWAGAGGHGRAAVGADGPQPKVEAAEAGPLLPPQPAHVLQGASLVPQFGAAPDVEGSTIERPKPPTAEEFAALSASGAVALAVADARSGASTQGSDALPNLYPARPSNWTNGPIVISGLTGTTANGALRVGASAYVDWAIYNAGVGIAAPFRTCLWMDNVWLRCWTSNGLPLGYTGYVTDWDLTSVVSPQVGWHQVGIWTDADEVIGEMDDTDNWWWANFYWYPKHAFEAWWMRDVRTGGRGPRDFTIFNDGRGTLTIDKIQRLQNSDWLSLVLPGALPIAIGPGGRASIGLTINGSRLAAGTYSEQIAIRSNDPQQRDVVIRVTLQVGDFAAGGPPAAASSPQPGDGADKQPPAEVRLSWTSSIQNGVFSVWMGETEYPTEVVCNGTDARSCTVTGLKPDTTYFWRVITHDGVQSTPGPIWRFTTGAPTDTTKRFVYLPIVRHN